MWSVVLPVKPFSAAKSRLTDELGPWRRELAHAFFLDTLRAVRATAGVRTVVVVTSDPLAAAQARTMGADVGHDSPGLGLNTAVRAGAARSSALNPRGPVAVLTADLPGLRPQELAEVLAQALRHRRAFVPDHNGTGTTVLTSLVPSALAPSFGAGSARSHAASGAFSIGPATDSGIRLDVDTPEDLALVTRRGVGSFTTAVLRLREAMDPAARPVQEVSASASS
ncbi:2-phospho-L-lactate guanylyltransferase [Streptomyces sp. NPDC048560]|uniref:2-phospho-L-lactate guanylyltransferase n=1 Tax=Streptomyces sp. NPDC048560 TaxID=3155488 RepID=UPI00341AE354